MRILVADDNIALREILTEVVSDAGHTAEAVPSADAALSSIGTFHPDIIILDIDMPNGQGLAFLDKMQNSEPPINIPVVVIRSWGRQVPQDISMVRCRIEKPFTSQDILESINTAKVKETETEEQASIAAKPVETGQTPPSKTLAEKGVSFGSSYVLFQRSSNAVHGLISMFDNEGYNVLIITTKKKKTIIERFRSKNIESLSMSIKLLGGHFNIYGLGTMIDRIDEFIMKNGKPVIAFDDLNNIIDRNGMSSALTAVHQLVTKKYGKDTTFLVSVDPTGFTTKDKEILLNHMIYHDLSGE